MTSFYVNDRRANRTLAEGSYNDAGEVSWKTTDGLTDDGVQVLERTIEKDVAEGYSGGQVPEYPHVEWLASLN